ncbi:MAG: GNAT family N-acetyltransferase [Erythrobacter sp.]|nr:MAG: GNAT family N-acetyltransferase [Erythrobacter sp.]
MVVMREAFDSRYGEAWTERQVADALLTPNTHFMISGWGDGAECDPAKATGFALSRQALDEEELLLIAVRPQFRGTGVGRQLLADFIAEARERGTIKIFLEMRCGNRAEHLYRKAGFVQVGLRRGYYRGALGGPIDAITFALDLG